MLIASIEEMELTLEVRSLDRVVSRVSWGLDPAAFQLSSREPTNLKSLSVSALRKMNQHGGGKLTTAV